MERIGGDFAKVGDDIQKAMNKELLDRNIMEAVNDNWKNLI